MVLGRLIAVILAVIVFVVAWRLLDILLGVSFGVALWGVKVLLFLALLYIVYRIFLTHRHPETIR
jgi:hypothetical protein